MNSYLKLLKQYSHVFPVGNAQKNITQILINRRQAHSKRIKYPCLFAGVSREPGSENIWHMNALKYYQEPALTYLTGINQPQIYLLLLPKSKKKLDKTSNCTLFVPYKDAKREFWDGLRFGFPKDENLQSLDNLKVLTGIQEIKPVSELFLTLKTLSSNHATLQLFYHQYLDRKKETRILKTDHNYAFYQKLKKMRFFKTILPFSQGHFDLRLPLDTYQQQDAQKANQLTQKAFLTVLQDCKNHKTEHDISNLLEFHLKRKSPFDLSFPSIVASGKNATILHYLKNDEKINPSKLILMDFGVRYGTMHSDISRTFPYNGKFNPLQRLLYNLVYKTLKFNQSIARVGITITTLNQKSWSFLEQQIQKYFIDKGGIIQRAYQTMPHGISHLMGEQEHDGDPFGIYKDEPMKENWQISNEPGLYGHFRLKIDGRWYKEWIGIRIEDNLIIKKNGCINLSRNFPVTISQIENQMQKKET